MKKIILSLDMKKKKNKWEILEDTFTWLTSAPIHFLFNRRDVLEKELDLAYHAFGVPELDIKLRRNVCITLKDSTDIEKSIYSALDDFFGDIKPTINMQVYDSLYPNKPIKSFKLVAGSLVESEVH